MSESVRGSSQKHRVAVQLTGAYIDQSGPSANSKSQIPASVMKARSAADAMRLFVLVKADVPLILESNRFE